MLKRIVSRLSRRAVVPALALAGLAVGAAPAGAVDFCVAPDTNCGAGNVAHLQTALDLSAFSDNADRIFLGAATYTAPLTGFDYENLNGPVELIGAGQANTILTGPTNGSSGVIKLFGGAGTTMRDLQVVMPDNVAQNAIGVDTNALVKHAFVGENAIQANLRTGVLLEGGTLDHTGIALNPNGDDVGVSFEGGATSDVRDSTLDANQGVISDSGGTIERSWVHSFQSGVVGYRGTLHIASSVVSVDAPAAFGIVGAAYGNAHGSISVNGVDIIGSGQPGIIGVEAENQSALPSSATIDISVDNSLMRGVASAVRALSAPAGGTGHANVTASYSDYDGSANLVSGPSALISQDHLSNVGNVAAFGAGDFQNPLRSSPLIDAGDPATAQGTDIVKHTLVTDGNGDGVAQRDIGAIELSGVAPPAPVQSVPSDSTAQPGATVPTGVADTTAPVLSGLRLTEARFAVGRAPTAITALAHGTRFRYTLSEAASVVVRIKHGKRTIGKLTRPAAAGANTLRFSGRLVRRALKAGRYTAVFVAADRAGNRSRAQRVRFRIVAR
jgi:hypothetical protein